MDITGMDIIHISHLMEKYLIDHFKGRKELKYNDNLFAEVIHLAVEEVSHLIPANKKHLFRKDEWINGAAGYVCFQNKQTKSDEPYTVMLVANDSFTHALFLFIMKNEEPFRDDNAILVKDFLISNK